ncbi:MAG: response regulator [Planctomycetota bacterium]|nr:MAG: response regulator [Planctomycetota bacterium]
MIDTTKSPAVNGATASAASAPPAALNSWQAEPPGEGTQSRPRQLLELLRGAARASFGGIGWLAADGRLREHWTAGVSDDVDRTLATGPCGAALIHFILRHPQAVRVEDFTSQAAELGLPQALGSIGPFLGAPLTCHGRPLGALYLARSPGAAPFALEDDRFVKTVQSWLQQGDLLDETRLLGRLRLLNQVAQATAGSMDLASILRVALHELERHLPLNVCAVWLLQQEGNVKKDKGKPRKGAEAGAMDASAGGAPQFLKLAAVNSAPPKRAADLGLIPGLKLEAEQTPFAEPLQNAQALYLDLERPEAQHSALTANLAAHGGNSTFIVPLRTGHNTVGVLQSVCLRASGFSHEHIELLYLVADLLGPAISSCQLYGRLRSAFEELRHTQNQLVRSEKMRALGEMAGGMAHDFNNALCGSLGFIELALTDAGLTPGARVHLESARICTLDAAATVRRVQDFARWQRREFSVQVIDLNDLVRQTMELTRHKWEDLNHARGGPITAEVKTEANAMLAGSAAELREVLTNLVFNSVDAMPQGGHLTVRTWSTPEDVFLSVSDTGTGMSDSVRHRLFEPFFTTKGERGNGLGLSVSFGIVQRYGGDITVESQIGKGSTFVVRLPIAQSEGRPLGRGSHLGVPKPPFPSAPGVPLPDAAARTPAASAHSKGLRILVIEDEEGVRRFLGIGLTHMGHRPHLTADGEEGLAAFAAERFDVVLTDLGLPGMSGEEVARAIAQQAPGMPVILLTGWSNQLRDEAKNIQGITRVLGKPVTLDALSKAFAALGNSQRAASAQSA